MPYVREGYGIYWALKKCRDYVVANKHETIVITDQRPLQWMRQSESPKIVRWYLECMQELTFQVVWRKGELNMAADALSRTPCVENELLMEEGSLIRLQQFWEEVGGLPKPPATTATSGKHTLLFHTSGDAPLNYLLPKNYRQEYKVERSSPTQRTLQSNWSVAVLMPEASVAPSVAAVVMREARGRPWAVLVPTDLANHVYKLDKDMTQGGMYVCLQQRIA